MAIVVSAKIFFEKMTKAVTKSMANNSTDFGTCYVCLNDEEPAPRSECACNTYLHPTCQRRMIAVQQNPRVCMVCRRNYANVYASTRHRECCVCVLALCMASNTVLYIAAHDWRSDGVKIISSCVVFTSAICMAAHAVTMLYTVFQHTSPMCDHNLLVRLL